MFLLVVLSCIVLAHAKPSAPILHPHNPQPYNFGYSVKDHFSEQHRHETGNGLGSVVGNYGFTDARGIARQVNYVADHAGFRAQVKTNEPGTANQNPAAVHMISHQPAVVKVVEPLPVHPVGVVLVPAVHGLDTGFVF
ncbi:Cuticle protein 16.8 like protein [Argiope bruennichi]|uniref:Cuticle protein 16.8 like protein n=1 Tax=Argiope bruennichi TaxID=94029 RepID=A0A8T0EHQ7_ARGBR|nr:Cuticle protein 16.8 like protein [Argiope bruennichi]